MTVTVTELEMLSALTAIRWRCAVLLTSAYTFRDVHRLINHPSQCLRGRQIATLLTQDLAATMPQRGAPVVRRALHTAGDIVNCALSQHRLESRRRKGPLQQLRVQLRTRCRCKGAVGAFSSWLHDNGQSPASDTDGLDSQLCQHLEWLWREGAHVGWAGDAISGCQFFLQKKRYFPAPCGVVPHLEERGAPLSSSSAHRSHCFCPLCFCPCMEFNRRGFAHCHWFRWIFVHDGKRSRCNVFKSKHTTAAFL